MRISNPSENNLSKIPEASEISNSPHEKRSYAISLANGASSVLTIFGAAYDLQTEGSLYSLPLGQKSVVRIHAADYTTYRDFNRYKDQFSAREGALSISGPQMSTPIDYRIPEGQAIVTAFKAAECRFVAVPTLRRKECWLDANMSAFKRAISSNTVLSIAVFQGLSKCEEDMLSRYFDDVFMVVPCEPDEDFLSACMVSPATGSFRAITGQKCFIENIRKNVNGEIERKCLPCISPDKLTREIYRLRKEGYSLENIGIELGFNKSTISRRLSSLPFDLRGDRI